MFTIKFTEHFTSGKLVGTAHHRKFCRPHLLEAISFAKWLLNHTDIPIESICGGGSLVYSSIIIEKEE